MPIARIRTFDPEAISFLAAKLVACGYQLQFAAPGDNELENADLEITVTRMDSATALEQARLQAEDMGVDVTVMPGVLAAPGPSFATDEVIQEVEQSPRPIAAAEENSASPPIPAWTTPYHVDVLDEPESSVQPQLSESALREEPEPIHSRTREAKESIAAGLKRSADVLGNFAASSAERMREWKRHASEVRERKRAQREQELAAARVEQELHEQRERQEQAELQAQQAHQRSLPANTSAVAPFAVADAKPRLVSSALARSRTLYGRDRRFRNAAIAAALVIAGGMIGWSLAGLGGPANPVRSSLANVQQQTPFGAASVSAPAQGLAAAPHTTAVAPKAAPLAKPIPTWATRTAHTRTRHRSVHRSASVDDGEVVVRHFGAKPVAQQAKAKTKDGVKIITEE